MDGGRDANGLSRGQIEVRTAKFSPLLQFEHISRPILLPFGYGKDRIVAMARDPWWIFVYWEITDKQQTQALQEIERRRESFERTILRVYDVTGEKKSGVRSANSYFDITLKDLARSWYVDVKTPKRSWCVEIGMLTKEGGFYVLARSNIVTTAAFGMSDLLDKSWRSAGADYWRILGAGETEESLKKRASSYELVNFGSFIFQR